MSLCKNTISKDNLKKIIIFSIKIKFNKMFAYGKIVEYQIIV